MLIGLAAIVALFTVLWLASLALKNASIVDIWWGLGFIVMAGAYLAATDGFEGRRALMTGLVVLWGLRLAWHIGSRNIGHGEDFRYAKWRQENGASWWWYSYFKVFLLQAVVGWIVGLPLFYALSAGEPSSWTAWDVVGTVVFGAGFLFEAIGDWQMRRFKADPANTGRLMNTGLWRYTRHPNYFGEAVLWWGLGIIGAGTPGGVVGLIGPAAITYLLIRVSGVAMLEATLKSTKPGYAEYIATTSSFVPMPPRRS
jgi:steroid 5-alpha reductase family enzyme